MRLVVNAFQIQFNKPLGQIPIQVLDRCIFRDCSWRRLDRHRMSPDGRGKRARETSLVAGGTRNASLGLTAFPLAEPTLTTCRSYFHSQKMTLLKLYETWKSFGSTVYKLQGYSRDDVRCLMAMSSPNPAPALEFAG